MTDVYKSLKKVNNELKKQLEFAIKDLKTFEERLETQEKNSASNGVAPVAVELARDAEETLSFLTQEYDDLQRAEASTKKELHQLRTDMAQLVKYLTLLKTH